MDAICKEIFLQRDFFDTNFIQTVYFGGGTPSVLNLKEWDTLFSALQQNFSLSKVEEITVEVNPDDVTRKYIDGLHALGVNRISMGIQSFVDFHLRKMNRRHNAKQAIGAIDILKHSAINNVSIDLIYGLPFMNFEEWKFNVNKAIETGVQHISAYHLTIEKGTAYHDLLKKGKLKEIPEEQSARQFNYLVKQLTLAGFEQYEISNFAKPGFLSRHNSSYWTGQAYLGLGPSAHSFKNNVRQWNVSDVTAYCRIVNKNGKYRNDETLSPVDLYNEHVMLGLRTSQGFKTDYLNELGDERIKKYANEQIERQVQNENIEISNGWCRVRQDKKMITDQIISDLFFVEE